VIASRVHALGIGRIVHLVIEHERFGERLVRADDEVVEVGADAIRADDEDTVRVVALEVVAVIAADHVHVQLSLHLLERHDGVVGVVVRAEQTGLFAGVPHEYDRPLRPGPVANAFASAISVVDPDPSSSAPLLMKSR
jgi:hypothetical protein